MLKDKVLVSPAKTIIESLACCDVEFAPIDKICTANGKKIISRLPEVIKDDFDPFSLFVSDADEKEMVLIASYPLSSKHMEAVISLMVSFANGSFSIAFENIDSREKADFAHMLSSHLRIPVLALPNIKSGQCNCAATDAMYYLTHKWLTAQSGISQILPIAECFADYASRNLRVSRQRDLSLASVFSLAMFQQSGETNDLLIGIDSVISEAFGNPDYKLPEVLCCCGIKPNKFFEQFESVISLFNSKTPIKNSYVTAKLVGDEDYASFNLGRVRDVAELILEVQPLSIRDKDKAFITELMSMFVPIILLVRCSAVEDAIRALKLSEELMCSVILLPCCQSDAQSIASERHEYADILAVATILWYFGEYQMPADPISKVLSDYCFSPLADKMGLEKSKSQLICQQEKELLSSCEKDYVNAKTYVLTLIDHIKKRKTNGSEICRK